MRVRTHRKQYTVAVAFAVLAAVSTIAVAEHAPLYRNIEEYQHPDGTYRGTFIDEGVIQVNVQFVLEDGVVTSAAFRHLVGALPQYNLETEDEPYRSVVQQYQEALQYLVGKPIAESLAALYEPGNIVQSEVDGYSGATIRANKILAAIRDALLKGEYSR